MARTSETLQLVIRAKETASKEFKKVNKALVVTRQRITSLRKTVLNLKTAFAGLAIGYTIKNLVSASNEQAKAVAGMETAMRSMGRYTPELSAEMQDLAASMQKVTNFGDELTIQGQKFLITYRAITDDLLPRSTEAMLDLAALMGGDAVQAANMLGKASMGMTGELRRVGITVDANVYKTEGYLGVLKAIESQVKGQARAMRKATGPWVAIGNAIGDVKEKLGDMVKITFGPFGEDLLNTIDLINSKIKEFQKSADFKEWAKTAGEKVVSIFESMLLGTAAFYDGIKPIIDDIKALLSSIWEGFKSLPPWVQKVGLIGAFLGGKTGKVVIAGALISLEHIRNLAAASALVHAEMMPQELLNKLMWEPGELNAYIKEWDEAHKEIITTTKETGDAAKTAKEPVKDLFAAFSDAETATQKVQVLLTYLRKLRKEKTIPFVEPKAPTAPAPLIPTATDAAKTKSHLARLIASTKTALLILANIYKDGEVTLQQYFDRRRELIEKQYAEELTVMRAAAEAETDPSKRLALEDKIFAKEAAHKRTLINLTREQIEAEKLLAQKKIEIDQTMADLRMRAEGEKGGPLQAGFTEELAEMDARHAEELARFNDLLNDKLAAEMGYLDETAALRDISGMQRIEKEKLLADQERRIQEAQLENAATIADSMASIFNNLYELSDEKQKEFFYLAKAAAIAEAIINTSKAVTGALGTPPYGLAAIAMAAIIAMKGGLEIAKIKAQTLFKGGLVKGFSPHDKADNISVQATAGEFMQPVPAVKYYGTDIMEGIKQKLFPRELFAGFALPALAHAPAGSNYAEGGPIVAGNSNFSVSVPINIGDNKASDIAGILQEEVEETVIRVMERELR